MLPDLSPFLVRPAALPDGVLAVAPNPGEPLDNAVLRTFAAGAARVAVRDDADRAGLHRARLFCQTFAEILTTGTFRENLPATGGLRASERHTRERGAIVFIANPTDRRIVGSVFPALPEIALGPGAVFAWVHDMPIGASGRYLGAYAGLVKSDAAVLAAHLRPDPFSGARVFVYGAPGETREVVLFGGGQGEGVAVTFADEPRLYTAAESEIVALSTDRAGATFPPDAPETSADPTSLGADWLLWPDGALERVTDWPPVATPDVAGWYAARLAVPAAASARLALAAGAIEALWRNGEPVSPGDFELARGENFLLVRTATGFRDALLLPDGACWIQEVSLWRKRT